MRTNLITVSMLAATLAVACSGSDGTITGAGGAPASGGATDTAAGGNTSPGNGGAQASGGSNANGGLSATGGASSSTGGKADAAGGTATGGTTGTGGSATGGKASTTGGTATGGTPSNTGGSAQTTGGTAAGGVSTGGKATGGANTGGKATATGGSTSNAGASSTGTCSVTLPNATGSEPGGLIPVCCTPTTAEKAYIDEVFTLLNAHRAANNLSAYAYDTGLELAIQGHCVHMSQHKFFDHMAPEASVADPSARIAACNPGVSLNGGAENIAQGQRTPSEVMDAWKNSSGHNANMLSKTLSRVGIGYVTSGNNWGQVFAD